MAKFKSDFLNDMNERGFIYQCSDFDGLDNALKSGSVTAYLGSDPTADSLHTGHLIPVMLMRWFQKYGNKPILLAGGATGRIGDPSGRDTSRPMLTNADIEKNVAGLKQSYSQFMKFGTGETDAIIVDNYDWFKNFGYIDFLRDYGTHFTVPRMLSMESVKRRLDNGMTFLEFNYMILQAVDFLTLFQKHNCALQLCGADQWGNCIMGVELIRRKLGETAYCLSTSLLMDASGNKIGKSAGNATWVRADKTSPYDYYQSFRNVADSDVIKMMKIYTDLPMSEIKKMENIGGSEINELKKILAWNATMIAHGDVAATDAQNAAIAMFESGVALDSIPSYTMENVAPIGLLSLMVHAKLSGTNSDARRLVMEHAVKIDDNIIDDPKYIIDPSSFDENYFVLSVGKKKHLKINIK